jgi:hypothetical protein
VHGICARPEFADRENNVLRRARRNAAATREPSGNRASSRGFDWLMSFPEPSRDRFQHSGEILWSTAALTGCRLLSACLWTESKCA